MFGHNGRVTILLDPQVSALFVLGDSQAEMTMELEHLRIEIERLKTQGSGARAVTFASSTLWYQYSVC